MIVAAMVGSHGSGSYGSGSHDSSSPWLARMMTRIATYTSKYRNPNRDIPYISHTMV